MADARAQEAFDRAWAGERLPPREWKVPYNGADGVPIREEILSTLGAAVVTRNSYGAACLNTPDVLFADLDFADFDPMRNAQVPGCAVAAACAGGAFAIAHQLHWSFLQSVGTGLALFCAIGVVLAFIAKAMRRVMGTPASKARQRVQSFVEGHPDWSFRLYETPAGYRLLATHRLFDPTSDEVAQAFAALGVDSTYAAMCRRQACFRARLTAKPWRIGVKAHMRPRPGIWPVAPERMAVREAWIAEYEKASAGFAACKFVESLGMPRIDPRVRAVQDLHDRLSQAGTDRPLA